MIKTGIPIPTEVVAVLRALEGKQLPGNVEPYVLRPVVDIGKTIFLEGFGLQDATTIDGVLEQYDRFSPERAERLRKLMETHDLTLVSLGDSGVVAFEIATIQGRRVESGARITATPASNFFMCPEKIFVIAGTPKGIALDGESFK